MKYQEALLDGWRLRTQSCPEQSHFSDSARQRITSVFLAVIAPVDAAGKATENAVDNSADEARDPSASQPNAWSAELATLALDSDLSAPAFCAELRNCQLTLLELLVAGAVAETQTSSQPEPYGLQGLPQRMAALDLLIRDSLMERDTANEQPEDGPESIAPVAGKKKKTLQHEIRTPLQGALLTTELMLEDATQGDPVSQDDILAVRKSIETAVSILNEFASQPSPE